MRGTLPAGVFPDGSFSSLFRPPSAATPSGRHQAAVCCNSPRAPLRLTNVVKQNIFVCGRGPALQVDQASIRGFQSGLNVLLCSGSALPIEFNGKAMTLQEWQRTSGQDQKSLSVEPGFVDSSANDFNLPPGSPAAGMGVQPVTSEGNSAGAQRPAKDRLCQVVK
jgi:hypothetical protein